MKFVSSIVFLIFMLLLCADIKAQTYSQLTEVLSSGGGRSTGGNYYTNFGVVGQTFVDITYTGGNYNSRTGFLYNYDVSLDVTKLLISSQSQELPGIFPPTSTGVEASITVTDNINKKS